MLWRIALCVGVSLVAACSAGSVRSICATDADCGTGAICRARECVAHPVIPPTIGDPGLESCLSPCGGICCQSGTECRNAECVPACESGVWCGPLFEEVCCAQGQHCEARACVADEPPPPSCPDGQIYDPALGYCTAKLPVHACVRPQTGFFEPEVLWEVTPEDAYREVITTPLVIDLDADGASEVIAPFFSEAAGVQAPAVLRALSGIDGHELWRTQPVADGVIGTSQLAAAVLGTGLPPSVVGVDGEGRLSAYRGDSGERLWRSRTRDGAAALCNLGWGAPAVADLDGDARPEFVCGFSVFDSNGVLLWQGDEASGPLGSMVALADLDSDGTLDLTDGTKAFAHDGQLLWAVPAGAGGLAAVADLVTAAGAPGQDGDPEVIVTRKGLLELREGRTGALIVPPFVLPAFDGATCASGSAVAGVGGAPSIGDVDGDGAPEVVVASGQCLAAMRVEQGGGGTRWTLLWGEHAVDDSSSVSGASLFDFDADGRLDVVHADETVLHLTEGGTGTSRYQAAHCSGTIYEEPVVADVDGDGSANLVVARNGVGREALGCDPDVKPGIVVLRERKSRWANTRPIWNQHAYSASYVCDGIDNVCNGLGPVWGSYGRVAMAPQAPWEYFEPGATHPFNGARANTSGGYGATAAADVEITHVQVDTDACPLELRVRARLVNLGQAPLRPGTRVRLAREDGVTVASTATPRPLRPGDAQWVTLTVPLQERSADSFRAFVDPDDRTAECDEQNNAFGPVVLSCAGVGTTAQLSPPSVSVVPAGSPSDREQRAPEASSAVRMGR